jgi:lipoprotein-anchoring transpeptidase ErfK/SrfK
VDVRIEFLQESAHGMIGIALLPLVYGAPRTSVDGVIVMTLTTSALRVDHSLLRMHTPTDVKRIAAIVAAGSLAGLFVASASALAQPEVPTPPGGPHAPSPVAVIGPPAQSPADPLAILQPPLGPPAPSPVAIAEGAPAGQNPLPFTGQPPFRPPSFNPVNGAIVGVAKPITIDYTVPIADRAMAEKAIHISSNPPVPGKFYWMNDTQVRWRPIDFWPAGTTVNIDAAGAKSSFRVGESLVATVDNETHQMEIVRNGKLEKTFPVSLGKPGWETPTAPTTCSRNPQIS